MKNQLLQLQLLLNGFSGEPVRRPSFPLNLGVDPPLLISGAANPLLYYGYYQALQQKVLEQFASQAAAAASRHPAEDRKCADGAKLLAASPAPFQHLLPSRDAHKRNVSPSR